MITVQQAFELAFQHHQADRLAEAEALYRQVLAVQPNHAGAAHFLGVLAHQTGHDPIAIELIERAITLDPQNSFAYSNLGEAYRSMGRLEEAIVSYRRGLDLRIDMPEAHYNLGNVFLAQGQMKQAIASYRRALEFKPDYAEAYINLGSALLEVNELEEALVVCQESLRSRPDLPQAHNNFSMALMRAGRLSDALSAVSRALQLKPDYAEAHNNLGVILANQGRLNEAAASYREALRYDRDYAEAHSNLGNVLRERSQMDEAVSECRRAIELKPGYPEGYGNLGNALRDSGRIDEAAIAYRRALELNPNLQTAKFDYSLLLLLCGDFVQGWPLYELRWCVAFGVEERLSQRRWNGVLSSGRRIMIYAEQGFGDAIQFVRYASLIIERGGEVILECPRVLMGLFRSAKGVREFVAAGDPLPPFDAHVPMLSLPLVFQTRRESIPSEVPYLFAEAERAAIWKRRLGSDRQPWRVGVAWAGNPEHGRSRLRGISLEKLLPLWCVGGVEFYSLQLGDGAEEAEQLGHTVKIIDHTTHVHDFGDTAALIMQLDLAISVDTAVAHLAGALGRPVWTMLPFVPDWRWGLEGEETPWYPTMRLFRQTAAGDWDAVVKRVAEELQIMASERRRE